MSSDACQPYAIVVPPSRTSAAVKKRAVALLLSFVPLSACGCSGSDEVYIPTETAPLQEINMDERPAESQGRGFRQKGA